MKEPRAPRLDPRRAPEFSAELRERARVWLPSWALADGERDFGRALLEVAARFNAEVAERLDRAGDKMRRGFLDWLAVRGKAARPARMPVVFKLADTAREAVLASAPIRMQVDAGGASVIFETETDVRLVPGRLEIVVGVDAEADADAVYFPPPGLSDLEPLEPLPVQWELKSFAVANATTLQVDPETGLTEGMILEAAGQQYRIEKADGEIITIDPPLTADLPELTVLHKVTVFAPFDGKTRNRQEHALYLGHKEVLDIESAATIAISGAESLREGVVWEYWGKVKGGEEPDWQDLPLAAAEKQEDGAVVLTKPEGAIEPRDIDGKNSRWIRALTKTVPAGQKPFLPNGLAIGVNAVGCGKPVPCDQDTAESPAAEGMANTTPLVLESQFLPLGREPRQFDAFYLGSVEAFSKKGAGVQLCFTMADASFASLSTVLFSNQRILAGVGADGMLHLLEFKNGQLNKFREDGLQPPKPGFGGQVEPGTTVPLDAKPSWRLPMWNENFDFLVAMAAGANVWVWHEKINDKTNSGWRSFGQLPATTDPAKKVDGLVYLAGGPSKLAALREGKLSLLDLSGGTQWKEVPTLDGNLLVVLSSIVPVLEDDGNGKLVTSLQHGMVGVSETGDLFSVAQDGTCKKRLSGVDPAIRPAAVRIGLDLAVVAADKSDPPQLVAYIENAASPPPVVLESGAKVTGALDVVLRGGQWHFLAAVSGPAEDYLGSWEPFPVNGPFFTASIPGSAAQIGGGPTTFDGNVVIPGQHADVFRAEFDPTRRFVENASIHPGIVLPDATPHLQHDDFVARLEGAQEVHKVLDDGIPRAAEVLHEIGGFFTSGATGPLVAYRKPALSGTKVLPKTLKLDGSDQVATEGSWLLVGSALHLIEKLDTTGIQWEAEVDPGFNAPGNVSYAEPILTEGRTAPFIHVSGTWHEDILKRTKLLFPGATPERQRAKAFAVNGSNNATLIALAEDFTVPPGNIFIVDGAIGEWSRLLGDISTNPELSWEYWNGKGWWKLVLDLDQTGNLKNNGAVRFTVPDDIASGDWAGRTNFWIRARLVGGDYGREKVTITTKPTGNSGETEQTIERSSDARPPSVLKLHISYRLCKSARPAFVLAQDSGSIRDQSDANSKRGTRVEAFVPLALTLGRLSGPAASPEPASESASPPCQCPPGPDANPGKPASPAAPALAARLRLATGRAMFIGLSAAPSGVPVNVLLIVGQESPREQFAPMRIEALVADRFVPLVTEDTTRALGESGLLSMSFSVTPTPRELFGKENLTWLRLTPTGTGASADWKPSLRGAYLNAVWATAAETLTRELLGSSDGAPNLTVRVARPPVLAGSLELRVKEPLSDEERQGLRQQHDANRVLDDVVGLPGDWVLWDRVDDPGDELPAARVYALDESNGEIRFGDGQHGMIPPIGRDSIVAFTYRRTEAGAAESDDVPANAIIARTALNLVSPVEGVEAVFAADRAAGGAPPERAERVVRFGTARLRHRGRAVTARDFEDLALESSPDIVQARCFVSPDQVRLVVVMRGAEPRPDAAEARELERLLLAAAPASLGPMGVLKITGPRVRRLRILLELLVATLDHAGDVSGLVQERIMALFDPAALWELGAEPKEEDIARALLDTRRLEGLGEVKLREVLPDGADRSWTGAVKRDELVMLDRDAVRLQFRTVEVIA